MIRTSVATLSEVAGAFKIGLDREQYGCGVPITVVVVDPDLDTNPATPQSVSVRVWSTREPAGETLLLTERGPSDRYFQGTIPTSVDSPVAGDGILSVNPGDDLGAEYVDALDCDGASNVVYRASAGTDCTPPVISSVLETGVTDVAATIRWTTDEAADSVVMWGQTKKDSTGLGVPGRFGQVILANCTSSVAGPQNVVNASVAIQLGFCIDITVNNLTASENIEGVLIEQSNKCDIKGPWLTHNTY